MEYRLGQHAIVIGGSLAGLMTARVLAGHFDRVTILERDTIDAQPAPHKSIPQGNHLHSLLLGGQQVMSALYPGFTDKLEALGSVRARQGKEFTFYFPDGKAYWVTGTVREPRDMGFDLFCQSRGLLEYCVRQCTRELPNVQFESESIVQTLVHENGRIHGVQYTRSGDTQGLAADFVVDASGRGSRTPRWLTELGFQPPQETIIGVDLAYASTKFRIPETYDASDRAMVVSGPPPEFSNGAFMEEIEGGLWHVTLAGRFGDYPPGDEDGFLAYAHRLPSRKLYELIKDAKREADILQYRFPTSVQRHYERLTAFPEGFLVLGDAICSFNPIYGQGMSSAALQVKALQEVLAKRAQDGQGLEALAPAFFPKAAEATATPWIIAANQDFAFPKTQGERPPDYEEGVRYFAAVDALTADDVEVQRLLIEVFNLVKPLSALNEEPIRSRALARLWG